MPRLRSPAALAAVLVLVVSACSGTDPAPETSAADAPLRSPTTTAPPPPALERVALAPVPLDDAGGSDDQRLVAVAAGTVVGAGGRLVAVGSAGGRPSVWWSTDGLAWQRPALAPEVFGEGATLADVVADPVSGGFVAAGGVGGTAAVWVSPDGEVWAPAEVDPGPAIDVVHSTRLGLLAFGTGPAGPAGEGGAGGADPAEETVAWQSFSGDRWLRAVDDPELYSRPGVERVRAVVDAGREVQALVEREGLGAELWRTTDGLFWSLHPDAGADLLPAGGTPVPAAATNLGSALVVVGTDAKADGVDAALWLSTGLRAFEQAAHDEAALGGDGVQAMTAVAPVGDRLVVVGTESGDDGDVDAVVWSSGIGAGVQRSDEPSEPVPGDQHVVDLAVLGTTAVAVGWEETAGGVDAVVWTVGRAGDRDEPVPADQATGAPPPQLAWQRVLDQEALGGPGEQRMAAVTALADGFVAAGSAPGPDGSSDGAVWGSVDGQDWSVVGAGSFGGPGDQRLADVAVGPQGLVAVGSDAGSGAVWTTPDGSVWTRAPHDEGVFGGPGDQQVEAVAALPEGLGWVGVGSDGQGGAAVWTSVDGMVWARVATEGFPEGGELALLDVTAAGTGLVAVGTDVGAAAAWTSVDGVRWSRADLGPGRATAVAQGKGGVVAVGSSGGDGEDVVIWRSPDGVTWLRVDGGELADPLDQTSTGVTAGEDVIVAVGTTELGGGGDAAAWTSADAATWARSPHDENALGGDQAQRMADVAAVGGLVVAVGTSGSSPESRDAAVWVADLAGGSARSRL